MPLTTRIVVKTSFVYLGLGAVLGALMMVNRWLPLGLAIAYLRVSHIQFLVVGWLTQLILGVTWWLFPLLKAGLEGRPVRSGQSRRGREFLFWIMFICLNASVLLRAVFAPLYSWTRAGLFAVLSDVSGLFLLAAAVAFVVNMWSRVRAPGR